MPSRVNCSLCETFYYRRNTIWLVVFVPLLYSMAASQY